ncbi:MAG: phage integrase N-terminal SAM-like domain-containing protein [Opitutaceae bacterium]
MSPLLAWFARFILPVSPWRATESEVQAFLTDLAVRQQVSPQTQKQALNALECNREGQAVGRGDSRKRLSKLGFGWRNQAATLRLTEKTGRPFFRPQLDSLLRRSRRGRLAMSKCKTNWTRPFPGLPKSS